MKRKAGKQWLIRQLLAFTGLAVLAAQPALSQVPVDENGKPIAPLVEGATPESFDDEALPTLSAVELEDVVGPVALYPDDLLAIVLPASTYPLQIVQAARFLERLESDPSLKPDEEWDDSVTALLNYPEVVKLMNEDIDWTWRLGEAVVAQQADVIAAIEAFRDKAYAAGNLKTDEHQTVSNDDGVIEIEPADEDVIYVPYYEPEHVVVYQPRPVYHYYPRAYPVYYYPYPYGYSFASGYFWGVTSAFTIGWLTDHLHVHHHSYWGHPFYGHHYPSYHYYRRPSLSIHNSYYVRNSHSHWNYRYRDGDYWRPRRHGGARPGHHARRIHYYRDGQHRNDRRQRNSDQRRDGHAIDRNRSNGNTSWASNRHTDQERRRNISGDRSKRNKSASPDSDAIRFRSRNTVARAETKRNRAWTVEEVNRRSTRKASFAPSSRRSESHSPTGSGRDRSRKAAFTNPRRQVLSSPPRQARSAPPVIRNNSASKSQASRRSQTQPSASRPSVSPPSAKRSSSGSNRRSENRSSGSGSRGSFSRGEGRSRKRH